MYPYNIHACDNEMVGKSMGFSFKRQKVYVEFNSAVVKEVLTKIIYQIHALFSNLNFWCECSLIYFVLLCSSLLYV